MATHSHTGPPLLFGSQCLDEAPSRPWRLDYKWPESIRNNFWPSSPCSWEGRGPPPVLVWSAPAAFLHRGPSWCPPLRAPGQSQPDTLQLCLAGCVAGRRYGWRGRRRAGSLSSHPRNPHSTPLTHQVRGEVSLPHGFPLMTWVLCPHSVWLPSLEHHLHLLLFHPCTAAYQTSVSRNPCRGTWTGTRVE